MKRLLLPALLCAALTTPAGACGPDFQSQLLQDRAATLKDLPQGVFMYEAAHLLAAPATKFVPVELAWPDPAAMTEQRDTAEKTLLGDGYAKAQAARASADADAAYLASEGLPDDARRYLAGAVALREGDGDDALRHFRSVLELPADQRSRFGIWARFALGRATGDVSQFEQLRAEVEAGATDPLGLAVASFGEEGRHWLGTTVDDPTMLPGDAEAIRAYAQQAAHVSSSGSASLLFVARAIINDEARLAAAVRDPLAQKLLTIYLRTRNNELDPNYSEQPLAVPEVKSRIDAFLDAVDRAGLTNVDGADQVSALAYTTGHFDSAARYAAKSDTGLAAWVRAKLALRAGDATAAAAAYALAAKSFPLEMDWKPDSYLLDGSNFPGCRIAAETGALALSRGDYLQAMQQLYSAAKVYWPDAAYVAERVLTVDELKGFVDANVPAEAAAKSAAGSDQEGYIVPSPATSLRELLARRLLRAGRYDDAVGYFDSSERRQQAQAYGDARRAGERGGRIARAEALWTAAALARHDGMELLGYEMDPDYGWDGGNTDRQMWGMSDVQDSPSASTAARSLNRSDIAISPDYSTQGERDRVSASRAQPLQRFHYRYVAADLAAKAAELVPQRSQAYAALLCSANGWLQSRDPVAAQPYYAAYVKNGPHQPWAAHFGRDCPAPDFIAAGERLTHERIVWAKREIRRNAPWIALGGLLLLAAIGWWWQRRRRYNAAKAFPMSSLPPR